MRTIKFLCDTVMYSTKPSDYTGCIQARMKGIKCRVEGTPEDLLNRCLQGYSIKPANYEVGGVGKAHFISTDVVGFDVDDAGQTIQGTIDKAKKYHIPLIGIYKTFSYKDDHQKHRGLILLPYTITDYREYELLMVMVQQIFNGDGQATDAARLFFGAKEGTEAIYTNFNDCVDLENIVSAFYEEMKIKYTNKNYARELKNVASKVYLDIVGGMLDIRIEEGILKANFNSKEFKYTSTGKLKKSYTPKNIPVTEYGKENLDFKSKLTDTCRLFTEFANGKHWVTHNEILFLTSNLHRFKGGVEFIKQTMRDNPHFYNDQALSISAYEYKVEGCLSQVIKYDHICNCTKYCEYWQECQIVQNYSNIYDYLKNSRLNVIEYVGTEPTERQSVEQVRIKTQETFKTIIEEMVDSKHGLYVLKSPTGIGKTEILTSFDWSNLKGKKIAFAMPTHRLKDDYVLRCEGKELWVYPKPQMVNFNNEVQKEIDMLYSKKLYKQARGLYFKELKKHIADKKSPLHEACKAYEHDLANMRAKENNLIATTHRDILLNPDGYDIIIYDEDIVWSSMEQSAIGFNTFENVVNMIYKYFEGKAIPEITKALKNFITSEATVLDLTKLKITDEEQQYIQSLHSITSHYIDVAIMGIYTSDYIIKGTEGNIIYGNRAGLVNKPSLVLSATANEEVYRAINPDVKFYDMGQVNEGGRLIQYLDKSYSRSYIRKHVQRNGDHSHLINDIITVLESQGKSYLDYTVITYSKDSEPEFVNALQNVGVNVDEQTYFGNCAGYDHLGGKNMVVLGTPNYPQDSYRMMGLLLFGNTFDVMSEFGQGKHVVNGFKKRFATFKDKTLQKVQQYAIETELLQAVGRARLLNNPEAQVLVMSGYPLKESSVVHYNGNTIIK